LETLHSCISVRLQQLLSLWDDYEREVGVIYAEGGLPVGF